MAVTNSFQKELIDLIPALQRFARIRTRTAADADDLAQDTIEKALSKSKEFTPGTNMMAWLFRMMVMIQKNKNRHQVVALRYLNEAANDEGRNVVEPSQFNHVLFEETGKLIERLPIDQKAALYLVVYDGCTYQEAANILDCEVGTVKSRVSRAREQIAELMRTENGTREPTRAF